MDIVSFVGLFEIKGTGYGTAWQEIWKIPIKEIGRQLNKIEKLMREFQYHSSKASKYEEKIREARKYATDVLGIDLSRQGGIF